MEENDNARSAWWIGMGAGRAEGVGWFLGVQGVMRGKLGGSECESVAGLLIAVTPPRGWIEEVQRTIVDFFGFFG